MLRNNASIDANRTSIRSMIFMALAMTLGGCATSAGLQQPAKDFVAAAGSLRQAESNYFDQIQAASDAVHRLEAIADYVRGQKPFAAVYAEFNKTDDFSKAKAIRIAVMTQLQNYAAQVDAVASGGGAAWVPGSAQTITQDVNNLASDTVGIKLNPASVGVAQTVVTKLAQAVIDNQRARQLQNLAQEAQEGIDQIAVMVEQDNAEIEKDNFASGLAADQASNVNFILLSIYDDQRVNSAERYAAITTLTSRKAALVSEGGTILAAVRQLQRANAALAKGSDGTGLASLWQQAAALAQDAATKPARDN